MASAGAERKLLFYIKEESLYSTSEAKFSHLVREEKITEIMNEGSATFRAL